MIRVLRTAGILVGTWTLVLSQSSPARATDCDMIGPEFIDKGMLQSFSVRCDDPFIGFIQVAADASFSPSFKFPITASQQVGNDHYITVTLRVPWDIANLASEFWFQGFTLDANGDIALAGPLQIPVGQGDRVYLNAGEVGKNLYVVEQEFEEATEEWKERTFEPGYTGTGYMFWRGSNHYNNDTHGRMVYRFKVEVAGSYALAFRSGHWGADLHNDCWCSWDDGQYHKVFCAVEGYWSWRTELENGGGFRADLDVGVHTLTFAARSEKFSLDRLHIFNRADYSRSEIEDESFTPSGHEYQ